MQQSGRSGARALSDDRQSGAVRSFVFASPGRAPPSPPLVRRDVPSRPPAWDAYLHGLVRRRASTPPPRCSSTTTHPHGHPRGATIPAAVLLPRRSLLPDARGRVRGGGPPPPIRAARPQRHTHPVGRAGPGDAERRPRIVVTAVVRRRRRGWGGRSGLCIVLCCVTVLICNTQHITQKRYFVGPRISDTIQKVFCRTR